MFSRRLLAAMAASMFIAGAHADDKGFYLGAGVGEATQSSGIFDGNGTSHRGFAGFSFNEYVAIEGGLVDGGTQRDTLGPLGISISSDGAFVSLLGKLPLGEHFASYAKMGYVFYDSTTVVSNGTATARESISDEDLSYGAGLEFRFGERLRLRADYEKVDVPDAAFDIYSLIATWHF